MLLAKTTFMGNKSRGMAVAHYDLPLSQVCSETPFQHGTPGKGKDHKVNLSAVFPQSKGHYIKVLPADPPLQVKSGAESLTPKASGQVACRDLGDERPVPPALFYTYSSMPSLLYCSHSHILTSDDKYPAKSPSLWQSYLFWGKEGTFIRNTSRLPFIGISKIDAYKTDLNQFRPA